MITRQQVKDAANQLASDIWAHRDNPGELRRVDEIRRLVIKQLADDSYDISRGRIGRSWVIHYDEYADLLTEEEELWPAWSEDQEALAEGLQPFIDALEGEDRVVVRLLLDGRFTVREIADQLNIPHPTELRRIKSVHTKLRAALKDAFGETPDEETT